MKKIFSLKKEIVDFFTILELLLVVAVMVILMSLLLPGLQKAKNSARQIKCANTLKQNFLYFCEYTNDNSNYIVPYLTTPSSTFYCIWGGKLAQLGYSPCGANYVHYLDASRLRYVYACEVNKKADGQFGMFYGYGLSTYVAGINVIKIKYPSRTPYGIESSRFYLPTTEGTYNNVEFCHNNNAGVLLLDGHTKYYKQSVLPVSSWINWYYGGCDW